MAILQDVLQDMKSGVLDFTVDGKCSNCGQCCSNFLPIGASEIKTIRRYMEKHHIKPEVRRYPTKEKMMDFVCPFRSEGEKKCTIYPVRPAICRDFQCDKPRKEIFADKAMYHGKYKIVDMRAEFFGGEPGLEELFGRLFHG